MCQAGTIRYRAYILCSFALCFSKLASARVVLSTASNPLQFLKVFSLIDPGSTQDFDSNYAWGEHFWSSIPEEWPSETSCTLKNFNPFANG